MTRYRHRIAYTGVMALLGIIAMLAFMVYDASAKGSSGGRSSSSSSSKSSSGSKSAGSGSSSKSTSASKPSSGSKTAPPVTKSIPPVPPRITAGTVTTRNGTTASKVSVPAGRSWQRDRDFLTKNPSYSDPYRYRRGGYHGAPMYYGAYDSPFFYLWLFAISDDDDSNDPLPPESDSFVAEGLLSYVQIVNGQADLIDAKREDAEADG